MPAPTFLFALAPQAEDALHNRRPCHAGRGAPVVALCPGGKTHNLNFTKSERYNISFQGIKGNKNSAPQKKGGEDDVCQSLFALCLLVSVVIKSFLFLKLNNIK